MPVQTRSQSNSKQQTRMQVNSFTELIQDNKKRVSKPKLLANRIPERVPKPVAIELTSDQINEVRSDYETEYINEDGCIYFVNKYGIKFVNYKMLKKLNLSMRISFINAKGSHQGFYKGVYLEYMYSRNPNKPNVYEESPDMHSYYFEDLPKELLDIKKQLIGFAPNGYYWKEDESKTSYYSWSEFYSLCRNESEFNKYEQCINYK